MRNVDSWRALYCCEDLHKARVVATCLAAMEYDVRLHSLAGPMDVSDEAGLGVPPFEVRVPASDWGSLAEVLDELIEEQEQFDELIHSTRGASPADRRLLVVMIVIVSTLAIAGAVEV